MHEEKLDQNQGDMILSQSSNTAVTGFVGGVFWGFIGLVCYYFNFTELSPLMILDPWIDGGWKGSWLGVVFSLLLLGIFGIVSAFLYQWVLSNFLSIWVPILYGALLFFFVFYILNPLFPNLNPLRELQRNTIITTFCLYVLFGVFVGYSISYDKRERKMLSGKQNQEKNA